MIADKTLTRKRAEGFRRTKDLDLSSFDKIEDNAAELISRKKRSQVNLAGLKSMSVKAACYLSQLECEWWPHGLTLGLKELSDEVAEALCRVKCALHLDSVDSLSDRAAECLGQYARSKDGNPWLSMISLKHISDAGLLSIYKKGVVWVPDSLEARVVSLRLGDKVVQDLAKHGFFKYVSKPVKLLAATYPGKGLGGYYAASTRDGKQIDTRRIYGADVEELASAGLSWFFGKRLRHLGVDRSAVKEVMAHNVREWRYGDRCFPIWGHGIGDSAYERAAFALIAILNLILEEQGSEERAFGVNEGNAFSVAFLTDALRKIIAKVADEEGRPVTQMQLEKVARAAIVRGEPPLIKRVRH